MRTEFLVIGSIITIGILIMGAVIYDAVDSSIYKPIESKITVEEHYNSLENKKAAVDRCMQILETNGYTMCDANTTRHGDKMFIVVKGMKFFKKDNK